MEQQELDKAIRASGLIVKHLEGALSDDEQLELDSWVDERACNRPLFSELTNPVFLNKDLRKFEVFASREKAALRKIERKLFVRRIKVV